jgi:hypothetical protein
VQELPFYHIVDTQEDGRFVILAVEPERDTDDEPFDSVILYGYWAPYGEKSMIPATAIAALEVPICSVDDLFSVTWIRVYNVAPEGEIY